MKRSMLGFMLVVFFSANSTVLAQGEQPKDTPFWYTSSHRVQWSRMDSLQKLVKTYTMPIVAQSKKMGRILDYRLLVHHTGGEYNVVIMIKYPSWAAISAGAGFADAFKVIEPNEAKRKVATDGFTWVFEGSVHVDNIYTEATN